MPPLPTDVGAGIPAGMPAMPMMPMPDEQLELKATGDTTNLLGYACARYELNQRGETMEIWATDKLLPFRAWVPNQPPRFGSRRLEHRWSELLQGKKLFPLLATSKNDNGFERLRFEVLSIKPQAIEDKEDALFRPPADYEEIEPLPY